MEADAYPVPASADPASVDPASVGLENLAGVVALKEACSCECLG